MRMFWATRFGGSVLCLLAFALPISAQAAVLSLVSSSAQTVQNGTVRVAVVLDTEGEVVNALEIHVPIPDGGTVTSVESGNSVVSLWVNTPRYDQKLNEVSMLGGMPGGFRGQGSVATIVLQVKKTLTLSFAKNTQVLLNDGTGAKAKLSLEGSGVEVSAAADLNVKSSTHPDQSKWYKNGEVKITWDSAGTVPSSILLDDISTSIPDTTEDEFKLPLVVKGLPDGIHYFHVRQKTSEGWGVPSHFRIQIDRTPPESFLPIIDGAQLQWNVLDKNSGIEKTTVSFHPRFSIAFPEKTAQSPYKISSIARWVGGTYEVIAYDRAGNVRQEEVKVSGTVAGALLPIAGIVALICVIVIFVRKLVFRSR